MDLPVRRVVRELYDAALRAVGKPLCLVAAQKMAEKIDKGDSVFIITGFPIPPLNIPETDGPIGAAVLIKSLQASGLKPILFTDDLCSSVLKSISSKTLVKTVSADVEQAHFQTEQYLQEFNPSILLAIERPGWNTKREYHNMRGLNISGAVGKTDLLFILGKKQDALTIGVGDGGNELGCGLVYEAVREYVPYGAKCQCPCNSGIAAATPADSLVIGGLSNWGAYGIAACLSLLQGLEYKHKKQDELQLLNRIIEAGAIDSVTLKHSLFVDGLSPSVNGLVVDLISAITNA
jgi:hypothetical protein